MQRLEIRDGRANPVAGRFGFTLIELLAVMAVVVVLAGTLLPALARAKDKATSAACLSNLSQLTLGYRARSDDDRGQLGSAAAGDWFAAKFVMLIPEHTSTSRSAFYQVRCCEPFAPLGSGNSQRDICEHF